MISAEHSNTSSSQTVSDGDILLQARLLSSGKVCPLCLIVRDATLHGVLLLSDPSSFTTYLTLYRLTLSIISSGLPQLTLFLVMALLV